MAASTMSLHRHHWSLVLESSFAANICSYDGEEPGQPILTTASIMAASTMSLHRHHWSLVLESSFAANICSYDGEEPGQPILTTASIMAASTMSLHRHHWSLVLESSFADQKPEAEMQTIGRVHGAVYRNYFLAGAACPYVAVVCFPYNSVVNHTSSCRTRSLKQRCRRSDACTANICSYDGEEPGQPILTTASIMAASTMSLHRHHWSLVLESSFAANICSYDGEEPGQPILTTASIMAASTMSLHRHHWSLVLESSFADQKPEAEMQTIGRVHGAVYRNYFLAGAACPYVAVVCFPYNSVVNHTSSCRTRSLKQRCRRSDACTDQKPEAEMQTIGRVHGAVYRDYFLAGAACPYVALVCCMFLLAQFCASACDYWISRWSKAEDQLTGDPTIDTVVWSEQGLTRNDFVLIFGVITIATICVALLRAFMFFSLCMRSSIRLHDQMFESIAHSPMSFFHSNPSGRILNRFSKDMGAVDELLPQAMIDCFQIILNLVGVLVVILLTDVTLLIPIAASLIIFYILRVIYIRTAGAVKRLEGITRSPVFSHLNATVLGMATIRSFGAENLLVAEFDRHQDLHSAAWYLFITCSRAFGYFLDVICLFFIICVTFSCLMKTDMEGCYVGLAITQSISLTGVFQWGMRQSAEMENQMTSVERVMEYTALPQEDVLRVEEEDKKPPKDWPQEGAIHFDNLSLKYVPQGNYVLHNLQVKIEPKEKIGIVGRTGAGKSSIIQALFRLAYLEGTIWIDGVDTSTIGLHDLREKLSIIPQEPVLFSGTMRKNLDPFDNYPDAQLMSALSAVELIKEGEGYEALDREVLEGGSNFSVGERQLVCLARAIVHNDKILVLDEATANVDAQTDSLIQNTIREHFKDCTVLTIAHRLNTVIDSDKTDSLIQNTIREHFKDCTVLTIAHRLNTVIDSDKILVLDAGRLMEFKHPHLLLQNKKSYFSKMVAETGTSMTAMLTKMAQESYSKLSGIPEDGETRSEVASASSKRLENKP
ncbi:ABC transporter transmembrane region domain-containing protein [Phthorimaea operculella]|nr:ABC transporter transmembrane region domain-containing protein [Phthorimaea operculella]